MIDDLPGESTLWWLSFADPDRPKGTQWLGACIVGPVDTMRAAVILAHLHRCNPGGEVQGVPYPIEAIRRVPEDYCNILLTRDDVDRLNAIMPGGSL